MKPILFNSDMVRAILDERKTCTRRVVKPQPKDAYAIIDSDDETHTFDLLCGNRVAGGLLADWAETVKAPYWPGDFLYVRETWTAMDPDDGERRPCCTTRPMAMLLTASKWRPLYSHAQGGGTYLSAGDECAGGAFTGHHRGTGSS